MTVLDIITYPDQRLKLESEEVVKFDESLKNFIQDLDDTMRSGPGGVGIAAPQVGVMLRIIMVDVSETEAARLSKRSNKNPHGHLIMINPEIIEWQGKKKGREGCLSVPDFTGNVIRAEEIVVTALDENAKPHKFEMEGFEARAVQHELDHLDGLLFLDRLVSRRNDLFKRKNYK